MTTSGEVVQRMREIGFDLTPWQIEVLEQAFDPAAPSDWIVMPRQSGRRYLRSALQALAADLAERPEFSIMAWQTSRVIGKRPRALKCDDGRVVYLH